MPNAFVAQITRTSSARKRRCTSARRSRSRPAWYATASSPEGGREVARQLLGARARARVDDRRQSVVRLQRLRDHRALLVAARPRHGEADVRPVEAGGHPQRVAQRQAAHHVARHLRSGRGGGRHDRGRAEHPRGVREPEVVRPEVVTPLGHAVRLVHHEQAHVDGAHPVEEAHGREALRRHVQQPQLPGLGAPQRVGVRRAVLLGVHERHLVAEPARGQRLHLVLHQRHERRDHHREVVAQQRRQLVAERLARPRGHHHHHVAVRQRGLARLALPGPEAGEAEVLVKRRAEIHRGDDSNAAPGGSTGPRASRYRRYSALYDRELLERVLAVRGLGPLERVVAREAGVAVRLARGADRLVDALERQVAQRVAAELGGDLLLACARGRPSPASSTCPPRSGTGAGSAAPRCACGSPTPRRRAASARSAAWCSRARSSRPPPPAACPPPPRAAG